MGTPPFWPRRGNPPNPDLAGVTPLGVDKPTNWKYYLPHPSDAGGKYSAMRPKMTTEWYKITSWMTLMCDKNTTNRPHEDIMSHLQSFNDQSKILCENKHKPDNNLTVHSVVSVSYETPKWPPDIYRGGFIKWAPWFSLGPCDSLGWVIGVYEVTFRERWGLKDSHWLRNPPPSKGRHLVVIWSFTGTLDTILSFTVLSCASPLRKLMAT